MVMMERRDRAVYDIGIKTHGGWSMKYGVYR